MKIVSDQDLNELKLATQDLAANILRILTASGKGDGLIGQIVTVSEAHRKLKMYAGPAATAAMVEALRPTGWRKKHHMDTRETIAEDLILHASLRIVAGQLLGQSGQETKARRDLWGALDAHRRAMIKTE